MPDSPPFQSRRRILFLDHTAVLGGGEIALLRLIENLDRDRYQPCVVLGGAGDVHPRLLHIGVESHVIPLIPSIANARKESLGLKSLFQWNDIAQIWNYVLKIARFIRAKQIDLIHTNSLKADMIGGMAARLTGIPCIWHVRDRIASDYLPGRVATLFRSMSHRLPNYVIANSCATLHTLTDEPRPRKKQWRETRDRDRMRVIYDGVSVPDQPPVHHQNSKVISLVGRISAWKGQHVFIEAASKVHRRQPDVRFQIVGASMFGEQEYEASLHELAAKSGLDDSLEFVGFHPHIAEYLQTIDVLVHASTLPEPFGQVVIEGMAAARPVIATRGGAIPEIVVDGETGILVPMQDSDAMADAMSYLIDHPQIAVQMGLAGYERVKQCFMIHRTAQQVQQLYDTVLGAQRNSVAIHAPRSIVPRDHHSLP